MLPSSATGKNGFHATAHGEPSTSAKYPKLQNAFLRGLEQHATCGFGSRKNRNPHLTSSGVVPERDSAESMLIRGNIRGLLRARLVDAERQPCLQPARKTVGHLPRLSGTLKNGVHRSAGTPLHSELFSH